MQVEQYLGRDDRAVLPLGSTEQHACLSLSTDSILAEMENFPWTRLAGGSYQKPDEVMLALWQVAVAETRVLLQEGWGDQDAGT